MSRVNAFTIIEVIIAMLISAVVIGLTYTCYSIISSSYRSFERKNERLLVIEQLDHLLKRDFNTAGMILKDSAGLRFIGLSKSVDYEFHKDYVLRISGIIDTFKVQSDSLKMSFEDQERIDERGASGPQLVDELQFVINYDDHMIPYHFSKQYSSSDLINQNPNAVY